MSGFDIKPFALSVAARLEFLATAMERDGRELLTLTFNPDQARALAALPARAPEGWVPTPLELDVLRACAGEIVNLPYDGLQAKATERLERLGLIYFCYEDDQPTHYVTDNGKVLLAKISASPPPPASNMQEMHTAHGWEASLQKTQGSAEPIASPAPGPAAPERSYEELREEARTIYIASTQDQGQSLAEFDMFFSGYLAALGLPKARAVPAPAYETCPSCGGHGMISTGDDIVMCGECKSNGVVPVEPAPAPVAGGEVVAWQRLNPISGWTDCRPEDVEHYRSAGQDVRHLYTTPDAELEALRERCKQAARNSCLVEPDGGEPTDAEALAAERAAEAVSRVPLREA